MSYLVKQADKSHQVRKCMWLLLADAFHLERSRLTNVFIYQENCIFKFPSRLSSFALPQYSNSPQMVYWNSYRISYSVAFWGETWSDFTLGKMLWEYGGDEGCAPTQMRLCCQAAWVTENFGVLLRRGRKNSGTVNSLITESVYLAKWYREVQFGLIENYCIQLYKGKKIWFSAKN